MKEIEIQKNMQTEEVEENHVTIVEKIQTKLTEVYEKRQVFINKLKKLLGKQTLMLEAGASAQTAKVRMAELLAHDKQLVESVKVEAGENLMTISKEEKQEIEKNLKTQEEELEER